MPDSSVFQSQGYLEKAKDILVLERRGQAEEAGGQGQEARRPRGDARRLEASR